MKVKMILPALTEAKSPFAGVVPKGWEIEFARGHLGAPAAGDAPDLVVVEVSAADAGRDYVIAREYRRSSAYVVLCGSHVTSQPDEASAHADTILVGPIEQTFPCFLRDWRGGHASRRYIAGWGDSARPTLEANAA